MKPVKFFFQAFPLIIASLSACVPYRYMEIEYFDRPSREIHFSTDDKLLILCCINGLHKADVLSSLAWSMDSVAASKATMALQEMLDSSELLSISGTLRQIVYRTDTSRVILPLTWQKLSELSLQNDTARWIISLDYMKVSPFRENDSYWEGDIRMHYGSLAVPVYCYWRIYDLRNRSIPQSYLFRDTLVWEADDWVVVRPGNQLPGLFESVAYAGADAGEQFASMLIPQWVSDSRVLFTAGGRAMRNAARFASQGKWLEAAAIWQRYFHSDSPIAKARAAFNLALANEFMGNLDLARSWLIKAEKHFPGLPYLTDYRGVIERRLEVNIKKIRYKH